MNIQWMKYGAGSLVLGAWCLMGVPPVQAQAEEEATVVVEEQVDVQPSSELDYEISTEPTPSALEDLAQAWQWERRPEAGERMQRGERPEQRQRPQMLRRIMQRLEEVDEGIADRAREALRSGTSPKDVTNMVIDALRAKGTDEAIQLGERLNGMVERMNEVRERGPRRDAPGFRGEGPRRGPRGEGFAERGPRRDAPGFRGEGPRRSPQGEGFAERGPRQDAPGFRGNGPRRGPQGEGFGRGTERPGAGRYSQGGNERRLEMRNLLIERFESLEREIRELQEQISAMRRQYQ